MPSPDPTPLKILARAVLSTCFHWDYHPSGFGETRVVATCKHCKCLWTLATYGQDGRFSHPETEVPTNHRPECPVLVALEQVKG